MAMSQIKGAVENWVYHAKAQCREIEGTIEPFPCGLKQPIKIEQSNQLIVK